MHMSVSESDSEILSENNCLSKKEEVEGGGPSDVTTSFVTSSTQKTKTTNGNLSGSKRFYTILSFHFLILNVT